MLAQAEPLVTGTAVTWRVEDPDGHLDGVRLWTDFDLGDTSFARLPGGWELEVERARIPAVDRLEYLFEETQDGRTVLVTDPTNPRVVGGAFGDHSWVSLGYREPAWLALRPGLGTRRDLVVEGTAVDEVAVQLWSPDGADPDEELPLLLSHDGPEMDHLGELTRFVGVMTALRQVQGSGGLPPLRVALLAPGPRDERYSANPAYADALCETVVPALLAHAPTVGRPVLMGQSLGALAALHAEWTHPGTFGGLLLQSGSFFTPALDGHESGHGRWDRITRFVGEVLAATEAPSSAPVGVCFGTAEENAANNRQVATALERLGVPVSVGAVRDGHTWTCWRDLLDPHLLDVLGAALPRPQDAGAGAAQGDGRGMTDRHQVELDAPGLPRPGSVIRYGHWGRPVLVFPSEAGRAWDYENNGMVDALRPLLDAGRAKLYCVDSFDEVSWSDTWISQEERARRHGAYAAWITDAVVPFVGQDSPGATDAVVTGCSLGAYHALQLGLTRADLFPVVIGLSGNYDPSTWRAWGEQGEAAYFTNPAAYVPGLHGEHLDWLRSRLHTVLVVGQGAWEVHPTQSLPQTRRMAGLLAERGISCELDVWGHDSAHDWSWWQRQIAHHLPRFC